MEGLFVVILEKLPRWATSPPKNVINFPIYDGINDLIKLALQKLLVGLKGQGCRTYNKKGRRNGSLPPPDFGSIFRMPNLPLPILLPLRSRPSFLPPK